jgi:hypothetical protein
MLSLVTNNLISPHNNSPISDKYHQWEKYQSLASQAHLQKDMANAAHYFKKSLSVSRLIKECFFNDALKPSGISLLYISSHNLAASLNSQNKGLLAKSILVECHEYLMTTCANRFKPKKLRLEALAYLDKSLFSLSSQLGYINEVNNIHRLIVRTERAANITSQSLLPKGCE